MEVHSFFQLLKLYVYIHDMSQPDNQSQQERELANRLAGIIENANQRVGPIIKNIRSVRVSTSFSAERGLRLYVEHRAIQSEEGG